MLTMTRVFSVIAILLFSFAGVYAQQTTGTISGTVSDETGGVLPGVDVTAQNTETGATRTAISDDEGRYRLSQLAPGTYQLRARAERISDGAASEHQLEHGSGSVGGCHLESGRDYRAGGGYGRRFH